MNFFILFSGLSSSPLLIKLSLIDFAVANAFSLSPCMQTESILQGISFHEKQFRDWFLTIFKTCFFAISGLVINALSFDLETRFPSSS